MEQLDRVLASWLDTAGIGVWILAVAALGSLLVAAWIFLDQCRRTARAGRMTHIPGRVRKLEMLEWSTNTGGRRGAAHVEVDYAVEGKTFTCRTWRLFRRNSVVGREPFTNFAPGSEVLVFYDPRDPGFSALVMDSPTYGSAVIAAVLCLVFVGLAIFLVP